MVAMHCTADEAFALLATQSQAQNRKLIEIAAEIAGGVSCRCEAVLTAVATITASVRPRL